MKKSFRFAFTLIEILVAATIIGLLAAGATVSYNSLNKQSRDAKRKADLEQIRGALEMFRSNNNIYTPSSNSLNDNCSNILGYLRSPTKYIESIPQDPKSNSGYYYRCSISQNDYTISVYLESGEGVSCGGSCGPTNTSCNYCVGPYGKK